MDDIIRDDTLDNVILVIGNGFDIANGYKTRYSDFLKYTKSIYEKQDFQSGKEARYKELIQDNSFIKHFIDYKYKLDTWVDVENEMRNIVKAIEHVFNDDARNFQNVDTSTVYAIINTSPYEKKVLTEFNFVTNSNSCYQLVSNKYYSDEYGIIWEEVNNELDNQLNGLKNALITYLKDFMIRDEKLESIKCIKDLQPNHIITFNYTDTYKEYYDCKDIYHVHGELANKNIVLGYEDNNPKDLRYIKFKKYFQRIQNHIKPIDERIFEEKKPIF